MPSQRPCREGHMASRRRKGWGGEGREGKSPGLIAIGGNGERHRDNRLMNDDDVLREHAGGRAEGEGRGRQDP